MPCDRGQAAKVQFRAVGSSTWETFVAQSGPIDVAIENATSNLVGVPGAQIPGENYKVKIKHTTEDWKAVITLWDNYKDGVGYGNGLAAEYQYQSTYTDEGTFYFSGVIQSIGWQPWDYDPIVIQAVVIAGNVTWEYNYETDRYERAIEQGFAQRLSIYKRQYPKIVPDERGLPIKFSNTEFVEYGDALEIVSITPLYGDDSSSGQIIKIYNDGRLVFSKQYSSNVEYVITCGDDCAADELKIWVNRSSNTFMCCKCCN